MKHGGCFETQVYFIETVDLFHIIDRHATPTADSWVVVRNPLDDKELIVERFHGQSFVGVVRVLEFYPLTESEQWAPRITPSRFKYSD